MFTRRPYRRTPSSIYFLSLSILGIIYLVWSLVPFFYSLDHNDPQTYSLFYCKVRLYIAHVLGLSLRYVVVLACVDRFIATRTDVRIRSFSSVPMAIKLVFVTCIVWFMIAIHLPILMDIRNGICGMFDLYPLIYAIYQIIFAGILPPVLMCIFSALTILSLHQRHANQERARQRDRHLMRMIIAEVLINVFTTIPYSSSLVYSAVTRNLIGKSAERIEIETFVSFVTQFIIYNISVAPFYLFILTSKSFRNEFINIFIKYWNKYIERRIRINPLNEQNVTAIINDRTIQNRQ